MDRKEQRAVLAETLDCLHGEASVVTAGIFHALIGFALNINLISADEAASIDYKQPVDLKEE